MQKEIQHTWFLTQPPATVWEYLTRADLISQWLMENDFQPIVGHHFMFRTNPVPHMDFDGNVYCQVLEVQPPKKLSYSWKYGPEPGKINLETIVTWTLVQKNRGTELRLVHTGFKEPENDIGFEIMYKGWDENIKNRMENFMNRHLNHETQVDPRQMGNL